MWRGGGGREQLPGGVRRRKEPGVDESGTATSTPCHLVTVVAKVRDRVRVRVRVRIRVRVSYQP